MITNPKSFNEEIIIIKEELAQARTELRQARDEFRDATYRLTQALRNIQEQKSVNIGLAAEP